MGFTQIYPQGFFSSMPVDSFIYILYGLDAYVPPKILCWKRNPQCMSSSLGGRRRSLIPDEVNECRALIMNCYYKRERNTRASVYHMWIQQEGGHLLHSIRKTTPTRTWQMLHWVLEQHCQPSIHRNKWLMFRNFSYVRFFFAMAAWADKTTFSNMNFISGPFYWLYIFHPGPLT